MLEIELVNPHMRGEFIVTHVRLRNTSSLPIEIRRIRTGIISIYKDSFLREKPQQRTHRIQSVLGAAKTLLVPTYRAHITRKDHIVSNAVEGAIAVVYMWADVGIVGVKSTQSTWRFEVYITRNATDTGFIQGTTIARIVPGKSYWQRYRECQDKIRRDLGAPNVHCRPPF